MTERPDSSAHPRPLDRDTPAAAPDGAPLQTHGDPLLAASEGATEGTEGTRHGLPDAGGPSED